MTVLRRRTSITQAGAPSHPELDQGLVEGDILDLYLEEVSREGLLKQDQENQLARRARAGDHDARQELVRRNLRFVISVAKKYQNRGLPLVDLIGEGNAGLLTAADKFNPDAGVKFISYAVWWIRQGILAAIAKGGRTIRIPLNRTADVSRVAKAQEILRARLHREPTDAEVSALTGLDTATVQALAVFHQPVASLNAPLGQDEGRTLADFIPQGEDRSPESEVLRIERLRLIEDALGELQERDAKVLRLYYGLEGGREHTLEEIGSMLNVTRERVRQLRDRALSRLRSRRGAAEMREHHAA